MARISPQQKAARKRLNERRLNVIALKLGLADQNAQIFKNMFTKQPFSKRTFESIKRLEKNISKGTVNEIGELILPKKFAASIKRSLISKLDTNDFERKATLQELKELKNFRGFVEIINRNDFYKGHKQQIEQYNNVVSEVGFNNAQNTDAAYDLQEAEARFIARKRAEGLQKK